MRRTTTLRALGAAVLAISLTGCMRVDMQLDLNSDDTVDGTMIFALSKQMSDMAESMGEDPESIFEDMDAADLPEGTEIEPYEEDDFVGQRYIFEGADLSEFNENEGGFGIVHEDGEFVVTGEMDMSDMGMGDMEDLEGLEEEFGTDMGDLEGMMDSFEINLSITFPGEVIEHDGELDGTTVTWTPTPGENLEINARAEESGGGGGGLPAWAWILIVAVVVIGLAAVLFILLRGRGQREPEAADAAAAPGIVPPPPAAEPDSTTSVEPEPAAEPEVEATGEPEPTADSPEAAVPAAPPPPELDDTPTEPVAPSDSAPSEPEPDATVDDQAEDDTRPPGDSR